jgi:glycosyltransferase involved in cell wall biosynthesis
MNICRITRVFPPFRDGISHHAYYLSKYQVPLGHKVWVLQPHHPAGDVDGFQVKRISLGFFTSQYGYKSVTGAFAVLAGFESNRLHARYRFDLIHGHGDIVEAFILKQFARLLGLPLVMTMHSRLSRQRKYRVIAPLVWRTADGIIAVSQEIAADLQALGVRPDKVMVISSGVELDQFTPPSTDSRRLARHELGIPDSVFVIVAVGNLNPMKGFHYLIEAVQLSQLDHLRVYIIGDGPLRAELESLAFHGPAVQIIGSVPHDQVRLYLRAADLFVLPSVDLPGKAEGTPTAVMEAMAAGLPVITTNSGGAKDVIAAIPGVTVVPQRDSQALADAILRFAKDYELRKHIGELNRERVMCRDWPRIASEVCQFYERIMAFPRG